MLLLLLMSMLWSCLLLQITIDLVFAGAARRAWPDSMLILCEFVSEFVSLCEIISRPLIG